MPRSRQPTPTPRLDRWGTLNTFTREKLAGLTAETGSGNAGLVWYALFAMAHGQTGLVRGASVSKLARQTGLARNTVRAAVAVLIKRDYLCVHTAGVVPVYELAHLKAAEAATGRQVFNG